MLVTTIFHSNCKFSDCVTYSSFKHLTGLLLLCFADCDHDERVAFTIAVVAILFWFVTGKYNQVNTVEVLSNKKLFS